MEGGYLKKAIVLIIIFIFLGSAFSTQVIGNHMNHDLYRSNSCSCPNEIIDVYVTYSERKIPVDHATVVLKSGYNHRETLTTNNKGFCRFEGDYNSFVYDTTVTANKDFCFSRTVNLGKISDREYQRVKIVLRNVLPIEKSENKTIYVNGDTDNPPGDGSIENPFKYIKDGVDAASGGDTVFVYNYDYRIEGGIQISKSITLEGESKKDTIIIGDERSSVLHLKKDSITVKNFTIKYSARLLKEHQGSGIFIYDKAEYARIDNNIIEHNTVGINVHADHVNIENNHIRKNDFDGINIANGADYATIKENTIYNNGITTTLDEPQGDGIDLYTNSDNNWIYNNIIYDNLWDGIWLDGSNYNHIYKNTVYDNQKGIHLGGGRPSEYCYENEIYNNSIKNNGGGIELSNSRNNEIYDNMIAYNRFFGVNIKYRDGFECKDNLIYHNNFIENGALSYFLNLAGDYFGFSNIENDRYANGVDAECAGCNDWDNNEVTDKACDIDTSNCGGNYWSDYAANAADESEQHGTWEDSHYLKKQISLESVWYILFYKIGLKGLDTDIIPVFTLKDEESEVFDEHPWCRKNGWCPSPPCDLSFSICNTPFFQLTAWAYDDNDDELMFEYKITKNNSGKELPIKNWTKFDEFSVKCGEEICVRIDNSLQERGLYNIFVRVYDCRDDITFHEEDGKKCPGFDGLTNNDKPLSVKV